MLRVALCIALFDSFQGFSRAIQLGAVAKVAVLGAVAVAVALAVAALVVAVVAVVLVV